VFLFCSRFVPEILSGTIFFSCFAFFRECSQKKIPVQWKKFFSALEKTKGRNMRDEG
jgi:hypothetical protein